MCGTCDRSVTWEQKGIGCETCDQWFHTNCQNIRSLSYDNLNDSMVSWHCIICNHPNYSTIDLTCMVLAPQILLIPTSTMTKNLYASPSIQWIYPGTKSLSLLYKRDPHWTRLHDKTICR